jgi:CRP-like cAMP-binding protein
VRSKVSNRSSDLFYLLQQVQILRDFPKEVCMRISELLIARHYPAGTQVVQFGESRHSLFIVAEGIVKSTRTDQDDKLIEEHFIATEFFGRRSLFSFLPQGASVHTHVDTQLYEFNQFALQTLLNEYPELTDKFAHNLAHVRWKRSQGNNPSDLPRADEIQHLVDLYRGQIEANYGRRQAALPS